MISKENNKILQGKLVKDNNAKNKEKQHNIVNIEIEKPAKHLLDSFISSGG